jgi:hypothetical protein
LFLKKDLKKRMKRESENKANPKWGKSYKLIFM